MDEIEEETQGMKEESGMDPSSEEPTSRSSGMSGPTSDGAGNQLMMGIVVGVILGVVIGVVIGLLMAPEDMSEQINDLEDDMDALQDAVDALVIELNDTETALGLAEAQIIIVQEELTSTLDMLSATTDELELLKIEFNETTLALEEALGKLTKIENIAVLAQPHEIHLNSKYLNFDCTNCHVTNPVGEVVIHNDDLYFVGELDTWTIRNSVDTEESCTECHTVFPTDNMDESYKDEDCAQSICHDDWEDDHDVDYINPDVFTIDDCLLCHGGNAWYQSTED